MDAKRERRMGCILHRSSLLGLQIEENRGEELFVRGWRPEGFNAETRNVVMLSPGGPDRRFCDYARGVTVAFACIIEVPHLEDPEDNPRRPHRTATELLYKAQLPDMPVVHVRAWRRWSSN